MTRKRIVILGSTGSIGINTLKVIERFPQQFQVVGLTACNNYRLLEQQIHRFAPSHVAVAKQGMDYLRRHVNGRKTKISDVSADIEEIASLTSADMVVIAMQGSAALKPFLSAVRAGKTVAPANKEALVVAGNILMKEAERHKARIIPIDSEQSAIFQCLEGQDRRRLKRICLTASGGALLNVPESRFDQLAVHEILRHPRWKMGKRITVDSATLMNKGFEVIEAQHLFRCRVEDIEVVIHPEAIIHSMVEFQDGSIIAQMGITDMRLPIQYALTYPERWKSGLKGIDFFKLKRLSFEKPDLEKFPSLALAIYAARNGGTLPSVLNAADETAVDAFLGGNIPFTGIYKVVEKVARKHTIVRSPSLKDVLEADQWAREEARGFIYH
ncbi:MAG: 1-deoxy-D-xylulose-5-phosphate reductoisomerase [Omnitrophica WOR_2 bacterium RIFCSPLOWO2_12_FULL_50_9]|nr:MAG: 1-deoxy-D-xylulose-5-phosphate reductoisomerase [Omnitrophica WOR_2 bacterium RIFCSPHIGHO2_02_FULL_50_17]OGX43504.1 MAG: 1-deoxy-D-xylulose-5-phosphate reductoisomerase [Omnitrophica WOR_2 bacterium RIFCSPLOWO2_12_FULL_50_9]